MHAESWGILAVVIIQPDGWRVSALGQAGGAGIQAIDSVGILFGGENVCGAGEVCVGLVMAEQVWVVKMPVAHKESHSVFFEFGVVRKAGESKNHLVYFGVAVAANGGNLVLERAQKCYDALWVVSAGQRVPGTVIKNVAQQKDSFAAELFQVRKCHFAGVSRTVNIRKN